MLTYILYDIRHTKDPQRCMIVLTYILYDIRHTKDPQRCMIVLTYILYDIRHTKDPQRRMTLFEKMCLHNIMLMKNDYIHENEDLKVAKLQLFSLAPWCQIYRVTEEA